MGHYKWMAVVCALAPALATGEEPVQAAPREELVEEIEVKARRQPRVDALEVREVRETPARDLGEALDQQLGLGKVRKGGIANDVLVRGLKKDDIAVVVDGTHVHGACPSRMDPPSFHLDYAEVDRVQVKRGPFDVTQPGGLGGVVEVRTRDAKPGPGTELNVGYGAAGAIETSLVGSYGWERADVLFGGSFKQGEPFRAGDGRNFTVAVPETLPPTPGQPAAPNPARFRDTSDHRTAYDVRTGWAKAGFRPSAAQRIEIAYTRQSATDVLYPFLAMDGTSDDTDRVNATWRLDGDGGLGRALAQAYFSRVEHGMDDRERCSSSVAPATCGVALERGYGMRTVARSSVWGSSSASRYAPQTVDALVGADFYLRGWDNTTTRVTSRAAATYRDEASIPDVTITDVGVYAQAKRGLGAGLGATVGLRLDVARSRAGIDRSALYSAYLPGADLSRSRTDALLSGNVQLDWKVAPGASLFLGYGHGARVPDPQERYIALSGMGGKASWVGDPSLRPVQSDELDLGARWTRDGLLVKAQAFHAWLTDYIALTNVSVTPADPMTSPTAKVYRNVSARTYGGEATAKLALPLHLFASAGLTYTRGENLTADTPLSEIPPLRASVALRFDTGAFFVEAEEQWAARQDRVDPALKEEPTDAWYITNLRLGGEWKGVTLLAGVRNAFDRAYFEHLSYQRDPFASGVKVPEPGRTVYSSLQYRF